MNIDDIEKSSSPFPFRQVKGDRGVKYKATHKHSDGTGTELVVEHNGHDHVTLDFRSLYQKDNKKIGNKRLLHWVLNTKEAVQFASLLMYLAEEHMRDSDEVPYVSIVSSKEKIGFGNNWINEDFDTAIARTEKRKSRSHLYGLMRRCIETCDDEAFIRFMMITLANWAEQSNDGFAIQQAEKSMAQLGLIPEEVLN